LGIKKRPPRKRVKKSQEAPEKKEGEKKGTLTETKLTPEKTGKTLKKVGVMGGGGLTSTAEREKIRFPATPPLIIWALQKTGGNPPGVSNGKKGKGPLANQEQFGQKYNQEKKSMFRPLTGIRRNIRGFSQGKLKLKQPPQKEGKGLASGRRVVVPL